MGIHPSLAKAAKLDTDGVRFADGPWIVKTESGSTYLIERNGTITGGSIFVDGRVGDAWGAAYRKGGPIRIDQIVVGLGVEIHDKAKPSRVALTTPVVSVRQSNGKA